MSFHVPVSLGLLDGAHVSSCKPHCPAPMGHASGQGEVTAGGDRPSSARKRVPPRPSAPRLRSNGLAGGDRPSSARKRVPPRPSAPGLRSNGLAGGTGPLLPGKECRPGHRPPGLRSNGLAGERGKSRLHVQTPRHTRTAPPGDYAAVLQALQLAWCSYPCVLARAPRGKGGGRASSESAEPRGACAPPPGGLGAAGWPRENLCPRRTQCIPCCPAHASLLGSTSRPQMPRETSLAGQDGPLLRGRHKVTPRGGPRGRWAGRTPIRLTEGP